jgi:polysaccharide export outer membrane protein
LFVSVVAAAGLTGCAGMAKRMGGEPRAPTASKPMPRLSASASAIHISTNVQPAAPAAAKSTGGTQKKEAVAAPAPAKTPAPPPLAGATAYRLRGGDPVIIFLRGILPKDDELQDIIDEAGYVNLPYIGAVLAAGRTTSQLEAEIQRLYIEKQIYKSITVNVVVPSQSFFVRGEARTPGRFPLITGMTVLQAISAAGGYSDFADPKGVNIIRGGKSIRVNARDFERHPEKDVPIEPGDVIVIPRSLF